MGLDDGFDVGEKERSTSNNVDLVGRNILDGWNHVLIQTRYDKGDWSHGSGKGMEISDLIVGDVDYVGVRIGTMMREK